MYAENQPDNEIPIIIFSRVDSMGPWFLFGAVLSYLAVIVNIFIIIILFHKQLISPATVLLQCLALTDELTALFTYGFEPYFINRLNTFRSRLPPFNGTFVTLQSPYCDFYIYIVHLACDCFHYMSIFLTTCIGFQKVVALQYPIWTKTSLTVKKTLVCCLVCLLVPTVINVPVFLVHSFTYKELENNNTMCFMSNSEERLQTYYHEQQPLLTAILLNAICVLMLLITFFITYKLCTNKFRTQTKRNEKRSIVMVFMLLFTVLLSEIPRIVVNVTYILVFANMQETLEEFPFRVVISGSQQDRKFFSFLFAILKHPSKLDITETDLTIARAFFEAIKFMTVLSCLSNIFIYLIMSQILRNEFMDMFINARKTIIRRCIAVRNPCNLRKSKSNTEDNLL